MGILQLRNNLVELTLCLGATTSRPQKQQSLLGIGISIGDVEVSRDAARRAMPPRMVRAELFVRLLGSRRVRSAAPRVAALLAQARFGTAAHDERPRSTPARAGNVQGARCSRPVVDARHERLTRRSRADAARRAAPRRRHGCGGAPGSGRSPRSAPHPARPIGVPPAVPRGHLPLVRDVGQHPREKLQRVGGLGARGGALGLVGAVGHGLRGRVISEPLQRDRIPGAVARATFREGRSSSGIQAAVWTWNPECGHASIPKVWSSSSMTWCPTCANMDNEGPAWTWSTSSGDSATSARYCAANSSHERRQRQYRQRIARRVLRDHRGRKARARGVTDHGHRRRIGAPSYEQGRSGRRAGVGQMMVGPLAVRADVPTFRCSVRRLTSWAPTTLPFLAYAS